MLDQHLMNEGCTLERGASPKLDGSPEEHDACRFLPPGPNQGAKRNRLTCPAVWDLWDVLSAELDVAQLVLPTTSEPLDEGDHEVVEPLRSVVPRRRVRTERPGQHDRSSGTATTAVAGGTGTR